MAKKSKVRFIRVRGRIIPIQAKREVDAAKAIISPRNAGNLAKIAAGTGVGAGLLFSSGAAQRRSDRANKLIKRRSISTRSRRNLLKASKNFNQFAKISKFGAAGIGALLIGSAISSIDKSTKKDEKSRLFNVGSQATSALGVATQLGAGFLAFRFGKRFEVAGRRGLNLFKAKDIKKLKRIRDV